MKLLLKRLVIPLLLLLSVAGIAISNEFYTHGSFPGPGSPGTSASMRAELDLISAGFDKLPALSGNANKAVVINGSGNGTTVTTGTLTIPGNFAISGAFATTITVTNTTAVTFPESGTLATRAEAETLTNKTFALGSNTFSGTTAQFNTALSDGSFATLDGAETLTTKTINLTSNTLTGTIAQFNTALSDGNFSTLAGTETLTNKTLTAPTISSPSISAPTITGGAVDIAVSEFGPVANKQMSGAINGLIYSISGSDATNDIAVLTGGAMASSQQYWMQLTSALTKQTDASWAVGDNAGCLDTGVVGNSDYFIWLIARSDTGVVDVLCSLSSSNPTEPANYDQERLIGWFRRTAGATVSFIAEETAGGGLHYRWSTPILSINLANGLGTGEDSSLVDVPNSLTVDAHIIAMLTDASAVLIAYVYGCEETSLAPSLTVAPGFNLRNISTSVPGSSDLTISVQGKQLCARASADTVDAYRVITKGFTWSRR